MGDFRWRSSCGRMFPCIVGEFCEQNQIYPIVLMVVAEDSQELFNLLVYPLCFPIYLWVVGCAKCGSDSQLLPEFMGELGHKLRTLVRYYFGRKTMSVEYIILKQGCGFLRHYCFLAKGDDDPLG